MPFSEAMIEDLTVKNELRKARFYNTLAIGMRRPRINIDRLNHIAQTIKTLSEKPAIAKAIEGLKIGNTNASFLLRDIFVQANDASTLAKLQAQIAQLESSKAVDKLNEALAEFGDAFEAYQSEMWQARGLYGILVTVERALNHNMSATPTATFEQALLTGVVIPTFELFKDLEDHGDLKIDSLEKIEFAKEQIAQAKIRYEEAFDTGRKAAIDRSIKSLEANNEQFNKPQREALASLEQILAEVQNEYRANYEQMTVEQRERIEEQLTKTSEEIGIIQDKLAKTMENQQAFVQAQAKKIEKSFDNEPYIIGKVFEGVSKELDYIADRVDALHRKQQAVDGVSAKTESQKRRRTKRAVKKVQKETGWYRLLSPKLGPEVQKLARKRGGKLLIHQSQARIAAMGHSDGLCGGYSAEFLMRCLEEGWSEISPEQRLARLKSVTNPAASFDIEMSTNMLSNDLYMRLESGLRWDIQAASEYKRDATLFEIKEGDKQHATHHREKHNVKAFFQRFVDGIMKNAKPGSDLMLLFFGPVSGHAVGLNVEKDGFLYHDSNAGYVYFPKENKEGLSSFLVDYLSSSYPHLIEHAQVLDFKKVFDNVSRYNLSTGVPEVSEDLAVPMQLAPRNSDLKVLDRMDAARFRLDELRGLIHESARQLDVPKKESECLQDAVERLEESSETEADFLSAHSDSDEEPKPDLESEPASPSKKRSKAILNQKPSGQQLLVKKAKDIEKLHKLIEAYMHSDDPSLQDQQVLKQRVMFELNYMLQSKHAVDLSTLKQLCDNHNLPQCEKLVKDIERKLGVKPKMKKRSG